MTKAERHLKSALGKIKWVGNGRSWCGYLTPMEIIQLSKYKGVVLNAYQSNLLDTAFINKSLGNAAPSWFYFTVDDTFVI